MLMKTQRELNVLQTDWLKYEFRLVHNYTSKNIKIAIISVTFYSTIYLHTILTDSFDVFNAFLAAFSAWLMALTIFWYTFAAFIGASASARVFTNRLEEKQKSCHQLQIQYL